MWPLPKSLYLYDRSPSNPTGPLAWSLPVEMPNFRAEAVPEPVGKAGGRVLVNTSRVDKLHEPRGGIDIFRDDGIGVMGAVPVDVIDGFIHAGDNFHSKDEIEVFMAEVIVFDDI